MTIDWMWMELYRPERAGYSEVTDGSVEGEGDVF
jgi:hypothetical protein